MKKKRVRISDEVFTNGNGIGSGMPPVEFMMFALAEMGVTADEYAEFLEFHKDLKTNAANRTGSPVSASRLPLGVGSDSIYSLKDPLPNADMLTLKLKIKMNGVSKPPMWRALNAPADMSFYSLHEAIQAVTNLEDSHLWQFQKKAYDQGYSIADPASNEDITHDAHMTTLTTLLRQKGDKLEYIYDFGDDWIFEVEVVSIVDRDGECCECSGWKSGLQPIEDTGGISAYIRMREIFENPPKTQKERRMVANQFGFDDYNDLSALIESSVIDIEEVNDLLADIP